MYTCREGDVWLKKVNFFTPSAVWVSHLRQVTWLGFQESAAHVPHTGAFDTIYASNIPVKIYHISNSNFSTDVLVDFLLFSLF